MTPSEWRSLLSLIIRKGEWTIPVHPYDTIRNKALSNLQGIPLKSESEISSKQRLIKRLLTLPLLGPFTASYSYYKNQKQWPTYVLHVPQLKLAYVRISKSACTSIQAGLLQQLHPDLTINELTSTEINYLGMQHVKPYLMPGYTCFTVVRDPINRFLSGFNDKCISKDDDFFYFQDYLCGIIKQGITINEFLKILLKIPDLLKDIHFRPQSNFLNAIGPVKVFKLESDYAMLNSFLEEYNIPLEHLHQQMPTFTQSDLAPSDIDLIQRLYQQDYDKFDYALNK